MDKELNLNQDSFKAKYLNFFRTNSKIIERGISQICVEAIEESPEFYNVGEIFNLIINLFVKKDIELNNEILSLYLQLINNCSSQAKAKLVVGLLLDVSLYSNGYALPLACIVTGKSFSNYATKELVDDNIKYNVEYIKEMVNSRSEKNKLCEIISAIFERIKTGTSMDIDLEIEATYLSWITTGKVLMPYPINEENSIQNKEDDETLKNKNELIDKVIQKDFKYLLEYFEAGFATEEDYRTVLCYLRLENLVPACNSEDLQKLYILLSQYFDFSIQPTENLDEEEMPDNDGRNGMLRSRFKRLLKKFGVKKNGRS